METELLNLLKELIRFKPVSENIENVNKGICRMQEFLQGKGLYCTTEDLDGRKILYASTVPGKKTDILLNAHMDVVPAITEDQYEPQIRDGKLYARGSSDCLGNAVTIAGILCDSLGKYSVGAIFTSDEEIGGETTAAMVKRGYSATKAAVILDMGTFRMAYAQKGILTVKLIAEGKGGHASEPWCLDNPIDKLCRGYLKLADAWQNPTPEDMWGDSLAATIINGGAVFNQVPDKASLTLNIRYIRDGEWKSIVEKIKNITGLKVEYKHDCPPVVSNKDAPAVALMKNAIQEVTGQEPSLFRMNGATDARHLKALNVPVIISGVPGDGCHSKEEWLVIDAITQSRTIFSKFLNNLK